LHGQFGVAMQGLPKIFRAPILGYRAHRAVIFAIAWHLVFLAVAVTIVSTHFTVTQRDDKAELAWVAWFNTKMVYPQMVTHLSINPAQHTVTALIYPKTLPLSETATNANDLVTNLAVLPSPSTRSAIKEMTD